MVKEDSLMTSNQDSILNDSMRKKSLEDTLDKSKDTNNTSIGDQSYKTELCRTWVEKNFCPYREKCRFAHGKKDLHEKSINSKNYKQKECNSFHKKGFCPYGPRCHFKHEERKLDDIARPYYPFLLNSHHTIRKFNSLNGDLNNNSNNSQFRQFFPSSMRKSSPTEEKAQPLPVFDKLRGVAQPPKFFPVEVKYSRDLILHRKILDSCIADRKEDDMEIATRPRRKSNNEVIESFTQIDIAELEKQSNASSCERRAYVKICNSHSKDCYKQLDDSSIVCDISFTDNEEEYSSIENLKSCRNPALSEKPAINHFLSQSQTSVPNISTNNNKLNSNTKDNKSEINSNNQTNTQSQALTGVPLHDGYKLSNVNEPNEMLDFTMTQKKPLNNSKKPKNGFVDDYDISKAYDKLSRRKIEAEYDKNVVYGKASKTVITENESNQHSIIKSREENAIKEEKTEIEDNENVEESVIVKVVENVENVKRKKNKSKYQVREIKNLTKENLTKENLTKESLTKENLNKDNLNKDNKENSFSHLNNKQNKNFDAYLNTSSNHNYSQSHYQIISNPISNPIPNQIIPNPNNRNFDVYFSNLIPNNNTSNINQSFVNNNNYSSPYPSYQQFQQYPPQYSSNNSAQAINSSQQFNNLNYSYATIGRNNIVNNPHLNTSVLSSFSTHPTNNRDPFSCPNCEDIYKMSIMNNTPPKILKCLQCNNVTNNSSLEFYLKKYKDELIKHRKSLIKSEEVVYVKKRVEKENNKEMNKITSSITSITEEKENNKFVDKEIIGYGLNKNKKENILIENNSSANLDKDEGGLNDDWAGWIDRNKKLIKENLTYNPITIPDKKKKKEEHNDNNSNIPDESTTKPDSSMNDKIENTSGPSVSEIFLKKKADLASKLEKRKGTKIKKEKEPDAVVDLPSLTKKILEKKERKPLVQIKTDQNFNKENKYNHVNSHGPDDKIIERLRKGEKAEMSLKEIKDVNKRLVKKLPENQIDKNVVNESKKEEQNKRKEKLHNFTKKIHENIIKK